MDFHENRKNCLESPSRKTRGNPNCLPQYKSSPEKKIEELQKYKDTWFQSQKKLDKSSLNGSKLHQNEK